VIAEKQKMSYNEPESGIRRSMLDSAFYLKEKTE